MSPRPAASSPCDALSERQAAVLRAVVASHVGGGAPIGSKTIAHLLSVPLSAATVRNTLAELTTLGLVEKPHHSSGRIPTERGLRVFVDALLAPTDLAPLERREIAYHLEHVEADRVVSLASRLLSSHTHQLGFALAPRLDRLVLRQLSLVRLSGEQLLVVLVSSTGTAHRRVLRHTHGLSQAQLDRIASILSERVAGRTLGAVRERLDREVRALRRAANRLLVCALELGMRALAEDPDPGVDLVIGTRLAVLEQPEFADPRRLRELFETIETQERLVEVLDQLLTGEGVSVGIGDELEDPGLRRCAVVAAPYGGSAAGRPLGALGVIGPSRMDFARIIPLVDYLSELVSGKLDA